MVPRLVLPAPFGSVKGRMFPCFIPAYTPEAENDFQSRPCLTPWGVWIGESPPPLLAPATCLHPFREGSGVGPLLPLANKRRSSVKGEGGRQGVGVWTRGEGGGEEGDIIEKKVGMQPSNYSALTRYSRNLFSPHWITVFKDNLSVFNFLWYFSMLIQSDIHQKVKFSFLSAIPYCRGGQ